MGFDSIPEKMTMEKAQELAGEYRKSQVGRGTPESDPKAYKKFEIARLNLQSAIDQLESSGVSDHDLRALRKELEYPKFPANPEF